MECPYCTDFQPNNKVRGWTVRQQLERHLEVKHGENYCKPPVKQLTPSHALRLTSI